MTIDNLTKLWLGKKVKVITTVGSQAWHYSGVVVSIDDTHITVDDSKEGLVSVPISQSMIRGMGE